MFSSVARCVMRVACVGTLALACVACACMNERIEDRVGVQRGVIPCFVLNLLRACCALRCVACFPCALRAHAIIAMKRVATPDWYLSFSSLFFLVFFSSPLRLLIFPLLLIPIKKQPWSKQKSCYFWVWDSCPTRYHFSLLFHLFLSFSLIL
jgi:cytochrome bd-type quinol oxidase subunit 2